MSLDTYNPISALFPGMEAIDFQMSSKLGKRLTDLFQTVIDYRENLDYGAMTNAQDQRTFRLKEVDYFFKSKCADKFKKIVEEETGVAIDKLYCFGGDTEITGMFAVDLSFGNEEAAADILGNMSGTSTGSYGAKEVVEDMMSMADHMDLKHGRVTSKTYGTHKKRRYLIPAMYFDINCAFNAHDFVPIKTAEALTAREIAAIMMHEIGHAMSTIEHASDCFCTVDRITNYTRNLQSEVEIRDFLNQFVDRLIPHCTKILKSLDIKGPEVKSINKTFDTLFSASKAMRQFVSEEQRDESIFRTLGSMLINGFIAWIKVLCGIFWNLVFWISIPMYWTYEIARIMYADTNSAGGKAGDLKTTTNNMFLIERWADEFVSRQGFGDDLASALNKIQDIFKMTAMYGTVTSARVRNWALWYYLMAMCVWISDKTWMMFYFEPLGYENQYQRIVRIKQNTYAAFKDPKMDGRVRDHYLHVAERLEIEAKKAKTLSDTSLSKALYNIGRNFTSPVRWFQLLKNTNLDRDISILFDRIDDLKNNKLYYISSKLASIEDKRQ